MFVKLKTCDGTNLLVNTDQVQAVFDVSPNRSNVQFATEGRHTAVGLGIDDVLKAFSEKPTSSRQRKAAL